MKYLYISILTLVLFPAYASAGYSEFVGNSEPERSITCIEKKGGGVTAVAAGSKSYSKVVITGNIGAVNLSCGEGDTKLTITTVPQEKSAADTSAE